MRNIQYILTMLLGVVCFDAYASVRDDLIKTQKEIDDATWRNKKLDDENAALARKSAELSIQMVRTAAELQASEAKLSAIEEKLRILTEQITEKTDSLIAHKKDLAVMIEAAIKLSQTPQEAVILMPGNMMENMKSSRALKMTADSIKSKANDIHAQMLELEQLKEKVTKNQEEAVSQRSRLEEKRNILKAQLAEHKAMQQKLDLERNEIKARVQALAKKAEDLKSLIDSLEKEQRWAGKFWQNEEIDADTSKPTGEKGKLRSFRSAKGGIRVPAAGRLVQRYGVTGRSGTSKGITIVTRDSAQVTSPYDAEVLFTGSFMEYGKVVILRHSDGFHTLLAGITKIDTSVGDFLLEGEPIGAMGDTESSNRLYMEMRLNNQPIDPTPWVRGLKK